MAHVPLGAMPLYNIGRHGADREAMRFGDASASWSEIERASNRRAWALREAGVAVDDLVTLSLDNGIELFEILFALWKIGAVPHMVSPQLPESELRAITGVAQPKLVIARAIDLQARFGALSPDFGADHPCTDVLDMPVSTRWKAMSSGGSTGLPKIIVQPGPNSFDPQSRLPLRFPADGAVLTTGPLYHNMPFITSLMALGRGLRLVGMAKFDAEEALKLIEQHRVAWVSFVPTMMARISRLPEGVRTAYDVSSLETVWHWASPMPPALKQEWIDWLGPDRIWELYGGTEGVATTIIGGNDWITHPGSVGRSVSDTIKIFGADRAELPPHEIGEVWAKPAPERGQPFEYLGIETHRAEDGFMTLGDYGWKDESGFLFIADRRTDVIVSGGANIYPAEVEGALSAHPAIESAVVIGLTHPDLGQAAHALIHIADGADVTPDATDLQAFLMARLVRYKIPRSFEFVDRPLRDDAGKVRRSALREERGHAMSS